MGNNRNNGKSANELGVTADEEQDQPNPIPQDLGHLLYTWGVARESSDTAEDAEDGDEAGSELDPKTQAHLGGLLRRLYNALLDEPVPDKLLQLLGELERCEKKEDG